MVGGGRGSVSIAAASKFINDLLLLLLVLRQGGYPTHVPCQIRCTQSTLYTSKRIS